MCSLFQALNMTHAVVVCPKQWLVATGMLVLVTDGDMCSRKDIRSAWHSAECAVLRVGRQTVRSIDVRRTCVAHATVI